MSAGIPYSSSKASFHASAPAPPLTISVPSMSKRIALMPTASGVLIRRRLYRPPGRRPGALRLRSVRRELADRVAGAHRAGRDDLRVNAAQVELPSGVRVDELERVGS